MPFTLALRCLRILRRLYFKKQWNYIAGAVVSVGVLISLTIFSFSFWGVAASSVALDNVKWSEATGLGTSVPACGSASNTVTCEGGTATINLSWSTPEGSGQGCDAEGDNWLQILENGVQLPPQPSFPFNAQPCVGTKTLTGRSSNTTYTYTFRPRNQASHDYLLVTTPNCTPPPLTNYNVTASIDSGSGTITGPGISCPGDCNESYSDGTWVTLIATPSAGYFFTSWASGAGSICGGQGSTCSALVDGDKTAGVNFSASPPPFNYSLSNSGTSNVTKTSGDAFTTNTITKTLTTGTTESVTLSLSGVPAGVSTNISNQGCSPTCTSVITFTVPSSIPVGTYPITVTGSPLGKQTNFNLVITGSPFTVSCSASPSPAFLGQTVTWTATISEGTPPFTYSWSGTNIPTSPAPNSNPFSIVYSTIGQKTATVTVTDTDSVQSSCPVGTVQIKFDPRFEEF